MRTVIHPQGIVQPVYNVNLIPPMVSICRTYIESFAIAGEEHI
jgi:hypothetical protein